MATLVVNVACGAAVRLVLAELGATDALAWRLDVSTPANSLLRIREGAALAEFGVSPYEGSSCFVPPLVLEAYGPFARLTSAAAVLPNVLFDVLAALLLHRLAAHLQRRHAASQPGDSDTCA